MHYSMADFYARMTVIRFGDCRVMLHSPCEIDEHLKKQIEEIGAVRYIVAPGSFHFSHLGSARRAFPDAEVFICPGVEQKAPGVDFDWFLGDRADPRWEEELEQVLIRGSRFIQEVAFFHKQSRTLILVDVLENITNNTPGRGLLVEFFFKFVFRMWNNPKPAPEYQLGWKDKGAAKESLVRILDWPIERVIIAHGDLIEHNPREILMSAWKSVLES